jgi:hypothetical protein
MMMTLDVPDNLDLPTWQSELGLAGATRKKVDGEGADLTLLTEMVGAILKDGPVNRACSALEAGMAALRRRAEKLLHKQHTEPRLTRLIEDMDRAVTEIVTIARRNDLRKAREARRAFVAQWLGGNQ